MHLANHLFYLSDFSILWFPFSEHDQIVEKEKKNGTDVYQKEKGERKRE
jgi:hypothetical protein